MGISPEIRVIGATTRFGRLLVVLTAFVTGAVASSIQAAGKPAESDVLDQVLSTYWKSQSLHPEPVVDDATFLRRAYLTVIGRIPTLEEAERWLSDSSPDKRTALLDSLLDSEGFVSHQFNLWADALRLQTSGQIGQRSGGRYFAAWLKNQIRDNVPYDEWVRTMLTAEGLPWENPASSYYLRDIGMPLDNMAITMQVFLGTQMQCAQCHNHPTDQWTRRDFYEMTAFRYAMTTREDFSNMEDLQGLITALKKKKGGKEKKQNPNRLFNDAARKLFQDMRWQTVLTRRELRFPDDYQYEDAEAKTPVDAHTIFGQSPEITPLTPKERIAYYADWLTAPDNPRFAKVVANRLWKSVMGVGAIEPIDDLRADSASPVPGLDTQLEAIMVAVDFNLRDFYRVLIQTDFFQRGAVVYDPTAPENYHFTGPTLRRLSAEQLWDSYAVLIRPDLDKRPDGYRNALPPPPPAVQLLARMSPMEMVDYLEKADDAYDTWQAARRDLANQRSKMEMAGSEELKSLQAKERAARNRWRTFEKDSGSMMMSGEAMAGNARAKTDADKPIRLPEHLRGVERASDLRSPEDMNHFLRVFGQSDRELVDNADTSATINQALHFLNSKETNQLLAEHAAPIKVAANRTDPEASIAAITIGFLTRPPTQQEMTALLGQWTVDPETTARRLAWAMTNTREFIFLQ